MAGRALTRANARLLEQTAELETQADLAASGVPGVASVFSVVLPLALTDD